MTLEFTRKASEETGNCPTSLCAHWKVLLQTEFRNNPFDSGACEQP